MYYNHFIILINLRGNLADFNTCLDVAIPLGNERLCCKRDIFAK